MKYKRDIRRAALILWRIYLGCYSVKNGNIFLVPNPHNLINPAAIKNTTISDFATYLHASRIVRMYYASIARIMISKMDIANRAGNKTPPDPALRLTHITPFEKLILCFKSISSSMRMHVRARISPKCFVCYPDEYPRGTLASSPHVSNTLCHLCVCRCYTYLVISTRCFCCSSALRMFLGMG